MNTNSNLTKRERKYHRIMEAKYLVLNLLGPPGMAKSAIVQSIADKTGAILIDKRLATMDETDLGVYPVIDRQEINGKSVPVLTYAVPDWATMTLDKSKTFIIVFEELNRASKSVRDAALGVLLERRIGHNFIFGDNVLMCATGNLGAEDGTEVEEIDTALKSRLITVHHDMKLDEWLESYGRANVHTDIIRYLEANPTNWYPDVKKQDSDGRVIVNPRTWTALSVFLKTHYGMESTVKDYGEEMDSVAKEYIGSMSQQWLRWLRDHQRVTVKDVLDGKIKAFKDTKGKLLIERDNLNEICTELKAIGLLNIDKKAMGHVIKLLRAVDEDVMYGVVWDLLLPHAPDKEGRTDGSTMFVKEFKKEASILVKKNEVANAKP